MRAYYVKQVLSLAKDAGVALEPSVVSSLSNDQVESLSIWLDAYLSGVRIDEPKYDLLLPSGLYFSGPVPRMKRKGYAVIELSNVLAATEGVADNGQPILGALFDMTALFIELGRRVAWVYEILVPKRKNARNEQASRLLNSPRVDASRFDAEMLLMSKDQLSFFGLLMDEMVLGRIMRDRDASLMSDGYTCTRTTLSKLSQQVVLDDLQICHLWHSTMRSNEVYIVGKGE